MISHMMNQRERLFYDKTTYALLSTINHMGLKPKELDDASFYIKLLRMSFTDNAIKQCVFLDERNKEWDFGYDSTGFCYAASVVFAMANGLNNWNLLYLDGERWHGATPHFYLQHKKTGKFLDITYDQFAIKGITVVPYEKGERIPIKMPLENIAAKFAYILDINLKTKERK